MTLVLLKSPVRAYRVLDQIKKRRARIFGTSRVNRYILSGGKYYFSDTIPGWPSRSFKSFLKAEIERTIIKATDKPPIHTVIVAITNRCYLRCSHCYEWANISANDALSLAQLQKIMQNLYEMKVHHIQLSGGEPLARFDDLIQILRSSPGGVDFWILTSGFSLTEEKARVLKQSGLVGADISLDHWDEDLHNEFRRNDRSFEWVRQAVLNCGKNGILTSLSLCMTRSFMCEDNLYAYLEMAKSWGVCMIRLLEPRAAGRFSGLDVDLSGEQTEMAERFFLEVNSSDQYRNYPVVMYPGYHQRRSGCLGAGNRYFYIDSIGDIHACPFCQRKAGNAAGDRIEPALALLRERGCHEFAMNVGD
jgi:MoaA/NifB/PqqE/SkfB family radical SAM enzyme